MTYFPDLSQYDYSDRELLSIGWLDADHLYPTGEVEDGLTEALLKLIAAPQESAEAFDECDLCGDSDLVIDNPHAEGGTSTLGEGEIHIEGPDGTAYAAPTMIHHYIVDHGYLPPEEFQQAVLAGR